MALLLKHGTRIDGTNALLSAMNNRVHMLRLLVDRGEDMNMMPVD